MIVDNKTVFAVRNETVGQANKMYREMMEALRNALQGIYEKHVDTSNDLQVEGYCRAKNWALIELLHEDNAP